MMENQHLYCHWDSHNENVLFNSFNDLDSHVKSHYQHQPEQVPENDNEQINEQEPVACHWDSCHELINVDEMWSHLKNFHFKDLSTPHNKCDPCEPDSDDTGTTTDTNSKYEPEQSYPYPTVHKWDEPSEPILNLNNAHLPPLTSTPITNKKATSPCTCQWQDSDGTCCNQVFPNSHELNAHLNSEHVGRGSNSYVCRWQGCKRECRPFIQRQKMVRHLQTHAKNWSFKCNVCGHLANDDVSLRQHLRIHSGEKPHVCKHCNKRFTALSSLTVHVRIHTGEKPLVCKFPGCNKRFSESSNLNKHMKTHLAKSAECPICARKFCRRDQLQRHIQVAHDHSEIQHSGQQGYAEQYGVQTEPKSELEPVSAFE